MFFRECENTGFQYFTFFVNFHEKPVKWKKVKIRDVTDFLNFVENDIPKGERARVAKTEPRKPIWSSYYKVWG